MAYNIFPDINTTSGLLRSQFQIFILFTDNMSQSKDKQVPSELQNSQSEMWLFHTFIEFDTFNVSKDMFFASENVVSIIALFHHSLSALAKSG
ncbi:hypothetical protein II582_03020 [bacterium]|nr:hypothetical protein [bacterium]